MTATETLREQPTAARWRALGTTVAVHVSEPAVLAQARAIVAAELEAIDLACSRFRPDSELERVNDRAPRAVEVSELLLDAVEVGLRAVQISDGAVDPALGEALVLAGYDRDFELLERPGRQPEQHPLGVGPAHPPPSDPQRMPITVKRLAGWRTIEVDRRRSTISVARGVRLDLGATAKALSADRAATAVHRAIGVGALVNLGGDLAVAGEPPAGGWRVFVTDDHRNRLDAPGQLLEIQQGGLATSSITTRRWRRDNETAHHIIDPRTQLPARSCWRTVSVAAATCVDANIASTAMLARGEAARAWLARSGLPARLVRHDGVVQTLGGWPAQEPSR